MVAQPAWESRIRSLLKGYKPASDASFRNNYKAAIETARLESDQTDLLLRARDLVERSVEGKFPDPASAIDEWWRLYDGAKDRLPPGILEAVFGRLPLPKRAGPDLVDRLIANGEQWLAKAAIARKLLGPEEIRGLPAEKMDALYQSGMPEALIGAKKGSPDPIWSRAARGEVRGHRLLPPDRLLVALYTSELGAARDERLLRVLADAPEHRMSVLEAILGDEAAATRFGRFLLLSRPYGKSGKQAVDSGAVIKDWLKACSAAASGSGKLRDLASAQVALARALLFAGVVPVSEREEVLNASAESGIPLMTRLIREAESAGLAAVRGVVLASRGDELFSAVQRFLGNLESAEDLDAATDPQSKAERYRGRKEVIQELLNVLESRSESTDIETALEMALFNVGVRPIGEIGAEVRFDARRHQPVRSGIVSGDRAAVVEPGRCLGEGPEAIVLVKAHVKSLT